MPRVRVPSRSCRSKPQRHSGAGASCVRQNRPVSGLYPPQGRFACTFGSASFPRLDVLLQVIPDGLIQCAPGADRDSLSHSAVRGTPRMKTDVSFRGPAAPHSLLATRVAGPRNPISATAWPDAAARTARAIATRPDRASAGAPNPATGMPTVDFSVAPGCGAVASAVRRSLEMTVRGVARPWASSQGAHHLHTRFRESVSGGRNTPPIQLFAAWRVAARRLQPRCDAVCETSSRRFGTS
jgi:hypothetical protein